jgi:threonine synthase
MRLTKNVLVVVFTKFYFISPPSVVQVVLSTAHPAKFSEAVTKALSTSQALTLSGMCTLKSSKGCWKKRGAADVVEPNKELVKKVIESKVGSAGNGV